jgi:hypothetical protein
MNQIRALQMMCWGAMVAWTLAGQLGPVAAHNPLPSADPPLSQLHVALLGTSS